MLRTLELRDFAIVDELALEFEPGFNALTGETGAGKSILVDALSLLTGGRADSNLIRAERDSALVQGTFRGAAFESAARRLARSGRHSARLDGELVTVAELTDRSADLIAIFGQHGATELTRPQRQREQLDRLLPPDARAELERYLERYHRYQEVERRLEELREASRERARRQDMRRFQVEEIDAADLREGEDERLEAEARSLRHAERIASAAAAAFTALADAEGNAVERAAQALHELSAAGRFEASLAALAADLQAALSGMEAVASEVEGFLADFQADPARLEAVEERLSRLDGLKRKYGATVAEVLRFRHDAAAELEALEHLEADTGALAGEAEALLRELDAAAAALTAGRRAAADHLARQVSPLLAELGMDRARFEVELAPATALGPHGRDAVRFLFVGHPGEPLASLADVASGGELSRLMLALNLVAGSDLPVLAFDEIDAGIGGRTARAVGELLKRLSQRHQVLAVTHLPQVAAFADAHYRVTKADAGGRSVTRVERLGRDERLREIARMLSGRVTETSIRHAVELLEQAGAGAEGKPGTTS